MLVVFGTHAHGRQCVVKVTSLCNIAFQRIQRLMKYDFKIKKSKVSKKKNPLFV